MTTHAEARAFAARALTCLLGHEPSAGAVKALAGIGQLETNYGDGWKGAGRGSNNMGAIQCGASWSGPRFVYVDTHPNPDGTSTPYRVAFRAYDSPEDGWLDLARVAFANRGRVSVLNAADRGDWYGVSEELHRTGYYEGFGKTVADRVSNHYRALSRAIAAADGAVAPRVPIAAIMPTLRRGAIGEYVGELQRELGIAADRSFGPITEARLREYQAEHGLVVDGIAGRETWAMLLGDDYVPEAA